MEEIIGDAVRMSDTRPLYDKVTKWLPTVVAAEKEVGNLISDVDPLQHVMEIRRIANQSTSLGPA